MSVSMKKYQSRLREHNGVPTLFVNDQPVFLNPPYPKGEFPYKDGKLIKHTIAAGIYLLRVPTVGFRPDGTSDISAACEVVDRFLAWKPKALFLVRTYTVAPGWWLDANPSEEMVFDRDVRSLPGYKDYRDASIGSENWLRFVSGTFESFCGQLHKKYGGRILGYQFGGGSNAENGPIGNCTNDGRWFCNDFGTAYTGYFRRWLKKKYGTSQALRRAWGDAGVTFANATVPGRLERMKSEWFTFRSPRRAQSADFYASHADRIEDFVIDICTSIKKATNNECLAGSHLGAIMDQGFHAYLLSQTMVSSFLRAARHPAVDTFTTPSSYVNKGPGGDCTAMPPLGSIELHGKLRLQDQDSLTRAGVPKRKLTRQEDALFYTYYKLPVNIAESAEVLKRDYGHALIRGSALWWHSLRPGNFNDADLVKTIARLHKLGEKSLHLPRGIQDSMAVIVDQRSSFHQQCANRLMYPMMYYQRQHFWSRTGVGWNVFVHDDLDHPRMRDYPVYLFLNTFYLSDEDVKRIEKKVKGSNATVIWTYAPGIQSSSGFDLKRVERLTGFRLKAADIEALPRITVTDYEHPYTRNLAGEDEEESALVFGPANSYCFGAVSHQGNPEISNNEEREGMMGPIIYVDDAEATVLGELDCLREPGFCVKQMDGWTSVYVSAPMLSLPILRNILRSAGAHIYTESDDVFYPGKSFLMMHTVREGEKLIELPEPMNVYDCWANRIVGRKITRIKAHLPAKSTALYYAGDLKKWESLPDFPRSKGSLKI